MPDKVKKLTLDDLLAEPAPKATTLDDLLAEEPAKPFDFSSIEGKAVESKDPEVKVPSFIGYKPPEPVAEEKPWFQKVKDRLDVGNAELRKQNDPSHKDSWGLSGGSPAVSDQTVLDSLMGVGNGVTGGQIQRLGRDTKSGLKEAEERSPRGFALGDGIGGAIPAVLAARAGINPVVAGTGAGALQAGLRANAEGASNESALKAAGWGGLIGLAAEAVPGVARFVGKKGAEVADNLRLRSYGAPASEIEELAPLDVNTLAKTGEIHGIGKGRGVLPGTIQDAARDSKNLVTEINGHKQRVGQIFDNMNITVDPQLVAARLRGVAGKIGRGPASEPTVKGLEDYAAKYEAMGPAKWSEMETELNAIRARGAPGGQNVTSKVARELSNVMDQVAGQANPTAAGIRSTIHDYGGAANQIRRWSGDAAKTAAQPTSNPVLQTLGGLGVGGGITALANPELRRDIKDAYSSAGLTGAAAAAGGLGLGALAYGTMKGRGATAAADIARSLATPGRLGNAALQGASAASRTGSAYGAGQLGEAQGKGDQRQLEAEEVADKLSQDMDRGADFGEYSDLLKEAREEGRLAQQIRVSHDSEPEFGQIYSRYAAPKTAGTASGSRGLGQAPPEPDQYAADPATLRMNKLKAMGERKQAVAGADDMLSGGRGHLTTDAINNILKTNPTALGQYTLKFQEAQQQGPSGVSALYRSLQDDPNFVPVIKTIERATSARQQ